MTTDEAREAILANAPPVVQPRGRRITHVLMAGGNLVLVDEDFDTFCARFQSFMDEEHTRGELFRFTSFYSWPVDTNGVTKMHIRQEPRAWTLDGCSHVLDITVEYLSEEPIEQKRPSPLHVAGAAALPFPPHGPGKRGR